MDGHDLVESRHPTRGSEETREKAVEVFHLGNKESGFTRRKLIRNTLIGALVVSPLPAVVLFRDLAPAGDPVDRLKHTLWAKDVRLTRDPDGTPIKASDVTLGSVFHVIPEGLNELEEHKLEEKAKAAVLLMRLKPERPARLGGPRGLELRRHRRLLQDLHARRLPGRALRAADPPPAVPLPPIAVRHHP